MVRNNSRNLLKLEILNDRIKMSNSFQNILRLYVTECIKNKVDDTRTNEKLSSVIMITINQKDNVTFYNGINSLETTITAYSTPLKICSLSFKWWNKELQKLSPNNSFDLKSISYSVYFSPFEYLKFCGVIPDLITQSYVKTEREFPYAYVISGNDKLLLVFDRKITRMDIQNCIEISIDFYNRWNNNNVEKIHEIRFLSHTNQKMIFLLDMGGCPRTTLLALIHSFSTIKGITKVLTI